MLEQHGTDLYMRGLDDPQAHQELLTALRESIPDVLGDLDAAQARLSELLQETDALEVLGQFGTAYLTQFGYVPEWANDRLPAHVEYLAMQVLPLLPQDKPSPEPIELAATLAEIDALLNEIFRLRTWALMIENTDGEATIDQEIRFHTLLASIVVRLPTFISVERQILHGLFDRFEHELREVVGFSLEDAIQCADVLLSFGAKRVIKELQGDRNSMDDLRRMVKRARRKGTPTDAPSWVSEMASMKPSDLEQALRSWAVNKAFADSRTKASVSTDELAEMASVSESVAESFLRLFTVRSDAYDARHHQIPSPTSPLGAKPLIFDAQNSRWMPSVPAYVWNALRGELEAALIGSRFKDAYLNHRGKFLEAEATTRLARALPGARAWTAQQWALPDGSDNGDLDGLVFYHDAALRLQCKSGSVTAPTRRGAPDRTRSDLSKLVGEAEGQHSRLRTALKGHGAKDLGLGEVAAALDAPLQLEVVATLDDLGVFVAEAFKLVSFGTLSEDEIPWIVSLHDLIVVTDLLQGPHLIHYLCRRARLNKWARVYAYEELDWLGHYLLKGLYFDDQLKGEASPTRLRLQSFTEAIDAYYAGPDVETGAEQARPTVDVDPELEHLLSVLLKQGNAAQGALLACLLVLEGDDESRRGVAEAFAEMLRRSASKGVSSLSVGWPGHGITLVHRTRALMEPPMSEVLRAIANKHVSSRDGTALWIAIGKSPGTAPQSLVVTDGRPVDQVLASVLRAPSTAPLPMGSTESG